MPNITQDHSEGPVYTWGNGAATQRVWVFGPEGYSDEESVAQSWKKEEEKGEKVMLVNFLITIVFAVTRSWVGG